MRDTFLPELSSVPLTVCCSDHCVPLLDTRHSKVAII